MGTGRITVELFSLEISVSVWKSLSCKAVGLSNLSAASWRRWEAWYSPSAEMIFARLSRSAWAWPAIDRCIPWGISTSFTSTTLTFTPHGSVCRSIIDCNSSFMDAAPDSVPAERFERYYQALQLPIGAGS